MSHTNKVKKTQQPGLYADAMERLMIYRWISALFASELDGQAIEFYTTGAGGDLLRNLAGVPEYREDARRLGKILDDLCRDKGKTVELAGEYGFLFHGAGGHCSVPPYESVYTSEQNTLCQQSEQEIRKLMEGHGLAISDKFCEPADHIAVEMEFMAYLAGLTAGAAAVSSGKTDTLLEQQQGFMADHLMKWLPQFTAGCQNAGGTGFYAAASRLALELIKEDSLYLSAWVPS